MGTRGRHEERKEEKVCVCVCVCLLGCIIGMCHVAYYVVTYNVYTHALYMSMWLIKMIDTYAQYMHYVLYYDIVMYALLHTLYVCVMYRSEVHRLDSRDSSNGLRSRDRPRQPRHASIDGVWTHDKFSDHDQLVSYPIQHQTVRERQQVESGRETVAVQRENKRTDINVDTM